MSLPGRKKREKRRAKRMALSARALLRQEGREFSGEIINVSDRGAYLATNAPYAVDDHVDLIIGLEHGPSNLTLTIPGRVARVDGRGIGLESPHIDATMLVRLELVFDVNKNNPKLLIEEFCKSI